MAYRAFATVLVQALILQIAFSQNINRIISLDSLLSNQLLLNQIAPSVVPCAPSVVPCAPSVVPVAPSVIDVPVVETVLAPAPVPTTTIIQDSTVANSLANALQLLIVSNLLSNTLPNMGEVVIPGCAGPMELLSPVTVGGLGGLGYVY